MQEITSQSIQEKIKKSNNPIKAIGEIKILLLSFGYKDYSDSNKLLFIKTKGNKSDIVNVDLRNYNIDTEKSTPYKKEYISEIHKFKTKYESSQSSFSDEASIIKEEKTNDITKDTYIKPSKEETKYIETKIERGGVTQFILRSLEKKKAFKLVLYYDLVFALFGFPHLNLLNIGLAKVITLAIVSIALLSLMIYNIKLLINETSINKKALKYGLYVASLFFWVYILHTLTMQTILNEPISEGMWGIPISISIVSFMIVYIISYMLLYLLKKGEEMKTEEKEVRIKTEQLQEEKKEILKENTKQTKAKNIPINIAEKSPLQKALNILKDGLVKIVILAAIISAIGGSVVPLVGLPGAMIFIVFPASWIYFSIKDSNTTSTIKHKIKTTTTDFMSDKQKPKDMNEVADALLKFKNLLDAGAISQKEFDDTKKDLLNKK